MQKTLAEDRDLALKKEAEQRALEVIQLEISAKEKIKVRPRYPRVYFLNACAGWKNDSAASHRGVLKQGHFRESASECHPACQFCNLPQGRGVYELILKQSTNA